MTTESQQKILGSRLQEISDEIFRLNIEKKINEELLQSSSSVTRRDAAGKLITIIKDLDRLNAAHGVASELLNK